jgi:hypothetical protein
MKIKGLASLATAAGLAAMVGVLTSGPATAARATTSRPPIEILNLRGLVDPNGVVEVLGYIRCNFPSSDPAYTSLTSFGRIHIFQPPNPAYGREQREASRSFGVNDRIGTCGHTLRLVPIGAGGGQTVSGFHPGPAYTISYESPSDPTAIGLYVGICQGQDRRLWCYSAGRSTAIQLTNTREFFR